MNQTTVTESNVDPQLLKKRKAGSGKAGLYLRQLKKSPSGMAGFVIILIVLFLGIFGSWVAPYDPNLAELSKKLLPRCQRAICLERTSSGATSYLD